MRILAIETSTNHGSVALLEKRNLVREADLPDNRRTAQSLAPALAESLEEVNWSPASVDLVAVTNGPGSFTGLRIAVTTAKTFAYAARAQLVALNTLHVLVEQLPEDVTDACAIMDAQRQQLFVGRFQRDREAPWRAIGECQIVDRDALTNLLLPSTVITGPVLARLGPSFLEQQARCSADRWVPRASTVGRLAWHAHAAGHSDDPFQLQPLYYRPSYAEEGKKGR